MKKVLIIAAILSSTVQAQVIMGPDGRNIGYATQYKNYTQYTDKNGNTGYSFTEGLNTTYTGRDGRVTTPDQVMPSEAPIMPYLPSLNMQNQPKRGVPQF